MNEPMTSGKRLNERVKYGWDYYVSQLNKYVRWANESGYLVGQVPPRNKLEELQELANKEAALLQTLTDPSVHPATKARAETELQRFYALRQEFA